MLRHALRFSTLLPLLFCAAANAQTPAPAPAVSAEERAAFHRDPQWQLIEPHLPNPATATAAQLETAADVLRARRFPEDALDYYGYALARGGNVSDLLNKMGVVRLELRQNELAHELFQRTVRAQKKNAQGWNNLGVTEYAMGKYSAAIADYRKATRINRRSPVYHCNLGMAYFESGNVDGARSEFELALALDPHAMEHGGSGGSEAHVLGTQKYAEFAFEMARVYARRHDDAATVEWLSKAIEAGFDAKSPMQANEALRPYAHDARVLAVMASTKQMRSRALAKVSAPGLGQANPAGASDVQRLD
jgi:tetratricopeptide (TPR) repeat protein